MNLINHVSLYNEFLIYSYKDGTSLNQYIINRNVNIIPLNTSQNYKIKNFNVSIGSDDLLYDTNNIRIITNLRCYLDDNPVFNRLSDSPIFQQYKFNGIINDTELNFTAPLVSDSSNQIDSISPQRFYNYLEQYTVVNVSNQFLDLLKNKTYTIMEMPLKNMFSNRIGSNDKTFNVSNVPAKDFYFNSNNYEYLVLCLFPFIDIPSALNSAFSYSGNFTINFDLIQENL